MSSARDHSLFQPVISLADYQIQHSVPLADGSSIAIATSEKLQKVFVLIFEENKIKRRHELESTLWSEYGIYSLSVIPDNQHVVVWNERTTKECGIVFINILTGDKVSSANVDNLKDKDCFTQVIPIANGKQLFVRGLDSGVQIWDIENLKTPKRIGYQKTDGDRRGFLLLPNEKHFISHQERAEIDFFGRPSNITSEVTVFSITNIDSTQKKFTLSSCKPECLKERADIFAATPDSQHLFRGSDPMKNCNEHKISIFNIADINNPQLISIIPLETSPRALTVSSDGAFLVSYHMQETSVAKLWDINDLKNPVLVETINRPNNEFINYSGKSIFIKPNGQVVTEKNKVIPLTTLVARNKKMLEAKQDDEKSTFSPAPIK